MRQLIKQSMLALVVLPSVAYAGHSGLKVPPAETFLLGGEQRSTMLVTGTNVGSTDVIVLSRVDGTETTIATVAPGAAFKHDFAVGETALIRNTSTTKTARVSVDFTGSPSDLSMSYAKPR